MWFTQKLFENDVLFGHYNLPSQTNGFYPSNVSKNPLTFTSDMKISFRHLLSDQTDPFNRSPLSMEQVIPNTELAEEIQRWIQERRSNFKIS